MFFTSLETDGLVFTAAMNYKNEFCHICLLYMDTSYKI